MTRLTVHEYAAALRPRYRAAKKREKGKILDELCQTTGLHRKAAIRHGESSIRLLRSGGKLQPARSRGRPRCYGPAVVEVVVKLWEVGGRMCGKLLASLLRRVFDCHPRSAGRSGASR